MPRKKSFRKNGPVSVERPINNGDIVQKIWAEIGTYEHQGWKVPEDRRLLASIAGHEATDAFYEISDSARQNIELRKLLKEPLRSQDTEKRNAAIKWIVYDWGNIPPREDQDEDRLFEMCKELNNFENEDVKSFIKRYKIDRIASWSKVLAFADSSKYAIFDARVAMALNAILDKLGHQRKFFMPQSISTPLNKVFSHVRQKMKVDFNGKKHSYMNYSEYIELLTSFVEADLATSVLEGEMRLFAQGRKLGNSYAAKYGLEIPYEDELQLDLQLAS